MPRKMASLYVRGTDNLALQNEHNAWIIPLFPHENRYWNVAFLILTNMTQHLQCRPWHVADRPTAVRSASSEKRTLSIR